MYENNEKISTSQFVSTLVLIVVGTGILTLPQGLAEAVGTGGWLVILIGGILTTLLLYLTGYIVKYLPGKNYLEILSIAVSKPIAYVVVFIFILYALVLNSMLLRIFGEVIKMFLLIRTPIEVIMFAMLLASVYLVRKGIETIGRLAEMLLPIILVVTVPLFLLTLQGTDFTNLLPLFHTPFSDILKAIPIPVFSFLGYEVILAFGAFYNKPEKINKAGALSMLIVTFLYLFLNMMVLARFGKYQTQHLIWPTISLFKTIEFPGLFIENVESVIMVLWVFLVFMSIAPFYYANVVVLGNFAGTKNNNMYALPLVPIIYFISLFPDSIAETYYYLELFTKYASTFVAVIVPMAVLISLAIQRRFKKEG